MTFFDSQFQQTPQQTEQPLPTTFSEAVAQIKNLILEEFDREITQKQLYYHSRDHITDVARRANLIFQTLRPYLETTLPQNTAPNEIARMQQLIELCAIAHDAIQIFIPQNEPHTTRRREAGISETATTEKLFDYIKTLNQQLSEQNSNSPALFADRDLAIIQEAISATICLYDPTDSAIYQPALYDPQKPISTVAQIIALADLGGLGIEGIDYYNQEGSLLFLEENPDIIPLLLNHNLQNLATTNPELSENIRQRLLKRARFQINLAKSRLNRYPREIQNLPPESHPLLTARVFQHLNEKTIQQLETTTPTEEETPLQQLIKFFDFDRFVTIIDT